MTAADKQNSAHTASFNGADPIVWWTAGACRSGIHARNDYNGRKTRGDNTNGDETDVTSVRNTRKRSETIEGTGSYTTAARAKQI